MTPEHMAVVGTRLASTKPGNRNVAAAHPLGGPAAASQHLEPPARKLKPWIDANSRVLYPLPLPEIVCDPGVFPPTQGSFLMWKYLWQSGTTPGKRCLDVGCGTGILSVQLALNGAQHVDAIDIQPQAVANMLTNAFRNGVAERVSGKVADLYSYIPEERYEVVVASLYQMPVDPMGETTSHRPVDFWGRNLLDHLISLLPDMLEEDGVAYVMQISVLGQLRTLELLERSGFGCKVIDFSLFHFGPVFQENIEQIRRVEELSDAYHLTFGEDEVMVMYLLEIRSRKN